MIENSIDIIKRNVRKILVLCIFVSFAGYFIYNSERLNAEEQKGDSNYPATGNVRLGTWNEGQAAFWDLDFLEHFRYFGPEQRLKGYRPEQPIKFSHVTHVQKNKTDCQFCHWSVAKAAYAAIPEEDTCMGCHKIIQGTTEDQQKEIKKLTEYYNKGEPIPWVKVHVMPDHVQFNHKRHVKAGVSCQSCHGQVPEMETVQRTSSMKMGWCVDCHRDQGTSIDCTVCHK